MKTKPTARKEYLQKLEKLKHGRFIKTDSFSARYGL